jgi:hypothetical protein
VQERAVLFKRWMSMAMGKAAHCSAQGHSPVRSHLEWGIIKSKVVRYVVGDFVYLQREMVDTLDTRLGARFCG